MTRSMTFAVLISSLLLTLLTLSLLDKRNQVRPIDNEIFFYYKLDQRLDSLATIQKAIETKYALIDIKQERLGLDIEGLFRKARDRERDYPNTEKSFYRAVSNLWFLDRVRQVVASFQDTHLQVLPLLELPTVHLGFQIHHVDQKYIITGMDSDLEEVLEIGDQIFALDGEPIDLITRDLQQYISSSSPSYREQLAVQALTKRSFRYPKSPRTRLTIRSRNGEIKDLTLAWHYDYEVIRMDAMHYLQNRGFSYKESPALFDTGFSPYRSPMGLVDADDWYGVEDKGRLMFRTGFMELNKQTAGVIQVYSFFEHQVSRYQSGKAKDWDEPISKFLKQLKAKNFPLILDLRHNPGGHVDLPIQLMSLIARSGESYPSYMEGFRVTPNIIQTWERASPLSAASRDEKRAIRQLRRAVANGQGYTGTWEKTDPIKADQDVKGFDQPIVALISPQCISACDIFALLLESSKRATLIGSTANGTGAGFFDWAPFSGSTWVDMHEIFQMEIPNMLFSHGLPEGPAEYSSSTSVIRFNRENRPVSSDIFYQTRREDVLSGHRGWYGKAFQVLLSP
ncbi:S41 family peptidase [Pseudobacteriovorax antillogorgiicola]|uniref:Peptidase family S41 n=1 Tax=Pseudobacteriovorax antillogorgiicola TaxID=1513793 RepID=A0A1Y6CCA3_9BACT|nr:S41 family peptidase [Pseudobacteriovorax antillogorgiicola]TCS49380.1 peptidase S41-like protein [Pseudobacteriovorax antillogorgiicola]SMF47315.1 Peptidase family S41 [Pseudobacteriovorax antillogorgiicola]